jgi:hypothetical protein
MKNMRSISIRIIIIVSDFDTLLLFLLNISLIELDEFLTFSVYHRVVLITIFVANYTLDMWLPCIKEDTSYILKDRRRRPEGGEWESIKILHWNLAYILNQTRRLSLITRPGPHTYWTVIGHRNRVRKRSENTNQSQQDYVWDRRQKSDRITVYILRHFTEHLVGAFKKSP